MHFQKLYADIFNASVPDAGSIPMLKKVADEYPYFSLGHFFLLKQAIDTGGNIDNIASKTALHFNNPFLLNEQLYRPPSSTNGFETRVEEEEIKKQPVANWLVEETVPVSNGFESRVEVVEEEIVVEPVSTSAEEEIIPVTPVNVDQVLEVPETETQVINERESSNKIPANNLPLNEVTVEPVAEEKPLEEAPLFEPLFASDYFASQGIKLSEEQQPTDRMGKQLKSFTEWLKTMKKVHDPKLPSVEAPVDLTVQNLAEKSNKEEEVLTEAMAEVFLQQGKTNKAKEIYEKLSLLNPSKSAYFAAKLEQIN